MKLSELIALLEERQEELGGEVPVMVLHNRVGLEIAQISRDSDQFGELLMIEGKEWPEVPPYS